MAAVDRIKKGARQDNFAATALGKFLKVRLAGGEAFVKKLTRVPVRAGPALPFEAHNSKGRKKISGRPAAGWWCTFRRQSIEIVRVSGEGSLFLAGRGNPSIRRLGDACHSVRRYYPPYSRREAVCGELQVIAAADRAWVLATNA